MDLPHDAKLQKAALALLLRLVISNDYHSVYRKIWD